MELNLFKNISESFNYLQKDFVGFSISISGLVSTIFGISFTLFIMLIIYMAGSRIRRVFYKKHEYEFYIDLVLGYITVGSLIGILGMTSNLYPKTILLLLFVVSFLGFSRHSLSFLFEKMKSLFGELRRRLRKDKILYLGVLAFVLIASLRLFTPEIREDAIGYHTSFPNSYNLKHTTMIRSNDPFKILPAPQLGEMIYVTTDSLNLKQYSRFIHFYFYLIFLGLILKISREKRFTGTKYAPLLFVTAPLIIGLTSSAYTDTQTLLCFLLSAFLLSTEKHGRRTLLICGIILGGMLASKLWTIVFILPLLLYVFIRYKQKVKAGFIFVMSSLATPSIWYLRAYLLTGNPLFPAFSDSTHTHFIRINKAFLNFETLFSFSPIFFLGSLLTLVVWHRFYSNFKQNPLLPIFVFIGIEFIIVNYPYGRFLLVWYVVFIFFASYGLNFFLQRNFITKIITSFGLLVIFVYYFTTTFLVLPYGFGWADTNHYLTRVLSRDNSSYYDFDHQFGKYISKNDLVATYGVNGFYYANFNHISVYDTNLKEKNANKLFINGGDINWFCNKLKVSNCNPDNFTLLSKYLPAPRYLYKVN